MLGVVFLVLVAAAVGSVALRFPLTAIVLGLSLCAKAVFTIIRAWPSDYFPESRDQTILQVPIFLAGLFLIGIVFFNWWIERKPSSGPPDK